MRSSTTFLTYGPGGGGGHINARGVSWHAIHGESRVSSCGGDGSFRGSASCRKPLACSGAGDRGGRPGWHNRSSTHRSTSRCDLGARPPPHGTQPNVAGARRTSGQATARSWRMGLLCQVVWRLPAHAARYVGPTDAVQRQRHGGRGFWFPRLSTLEKVWRVQPSLAAAWVTVQPCAVVAHRRFSPGCAGSCIIGIRTTGRRHMRSRFVPFGGQRPRRGPAGESGTRGMYRTGLRPGP